MALRAWLRHIVRRVHQTLMSMIASLNQVAWRQESSRRIRTATDSRDAISLPRLVSMLSVPGVIVEVGSHVGSDTEMFALLCPRAHIWAFEPDPQQFAKAWRRLSRYPNVSLMQAAVGSSSGFTSFYRSGGSSDASGSMLRPTRHLELYPSVKFDVTVPIVVPLVSLSSLASLANIASIDLLWMDVQGAEIHVIDGMGGLLSRTQYIYAEASTHALYEGGATSRQLIDKLESAGFRVVETFMPSGEDSVGNILFANNASQP